MVLRLSVPLREERSRVSFVTAAVILLIKISPVLLPKRSGCGNYVLLVHHRVLIGVHGGAQSQETTAACKLRPREREARRAGHVLGGVTAAETEEAQGVVIFRNQCHRTRTAPTRPDTGG